MWLNRRSYSNPIYELIEQSGSASFTRPLMIDVEPICPSYPSTNSNQIPLLLLANCLTSPPPLPPSNTQHNYVNQRIHDILEEENDANLNPLYAKPRKRCVTLSDEPVIIPPKTSRISLKPIKPERAQLVSTTLPTVNVLSSNDSTDEIDQFIARENDRVERVKLRRHQNKSYGTRPKQSIKPPPAFSNPNYVEMTINRENEEKKKLSKSILV